MNNLDLNYQSLVKEIIYKGVKKSDRTGTGTISIFGTTIRHKMSEGFPILTTKKIVWNSIVTELLWFLNGYTNLRYLLENNCNIWNGDAYKKFQNASPLHKDISKEDFINKIKTDDEFNKFWGDLGPIYGKQWRNWGERKHDSISNEYFIGIDQIDNLINELKTNPDSRRLVVSAWNVGDLDKMVLPPCHYSFQIYTRELSLNERGELFKKTYPDKLLDDFAPGGMEIQSMTHQLSTRYDNANVPKRAISLMWNQRSVDVGLGLPFNISSYGLLLVILGKIVNMVPEELIGKLGDTHIYQDHVYNLEEQCNRRPFNLPKLNFSRSISFNNIDEFLHTCNPSKIELVDYESHPKINLNLSN